MKYLVRHWINVDMIAEEVIDGDGVDLKTNNIGKHEEPSDKASYIVSDYIKVKRRTIEDYDEKSDDSDKKRISD
jgi:hypothetical protein|tara:strand:- start:4525 stop:4746 length:222 start_codon:yes stop_codon:yes gene_type:complete